MRPICCLVLFLVTQSALAGSDAERSLIGLENDFVHALVRRDSATFERLLAPDFIYTEDATLMTREELLRALIADHYSSASNEEMKVHLHGDTAVVTGILRTEGTGKEGVFAHRYRFTDTWLSRHGQWQLIAAQDYLMPK
jgi:ketosteroid isomerase-like protein